MSVWVYPSPNTPLREFGCLFGKFFLKFFNGFPFPKITLFKKFFYFFIFFLLMMAGVCIFAVGLKFAQFVLVVCSFVFPLCCEVRRDFLKKDEKSFGKLRKVCIFVVSRCEGSNDNSDWGTQSLIT